MNCMLGMKEFSDKHFKLAIVDPPYFSGPERREFYGRRISPIGVKRFYRKSQHWDVPDASYFDELIRISENQIIWGCNYYEYQFGPGRIVWDKCNGASSFSDCEIAYCSMHDSVRLYRYMWNGMMQGKSINEGWIQQGNKALNEVRISPTQKPVLLYKWLLREYAKEGWKILDTHAGSGSQEIACYDMGFEYMAFEKDPYMHALSTKRINAHKAQQRFEFTEA
jgi:site-specific DNA-methyltransferase (adenine-specific)